MQLAEKGKLKLDVPIAMPIFLTILATCLPLFGNSNIINLASLMAVSFLNSVVFH